ncbi:MAG TPA: phage tail family protein [Fervidobacterium sp.]|nr:phage tail family protein [Fervidobacterium sp.]
MIKSITVTNYLGDSIKLELGRPEKSGFLIESISGLGPSKANINTTEVSTNDGSLFNSARLNQRNIVFEIIFVETINGESIEDVRQKSYKYFPLKKKLDLLIETDNRIAKTTGYVESNEPNIFSSREGSQISIICPDPHFYSAGPDGNNTTVFYGIEPVFEFPFSNESLTDPLITFGNIHFKTENVITYKGDTEIGVTIHIHAIGEAENITIYNTGTREIMRIDTTKLESLTGSGIVAGDDIIIKTQKGDKSITLIREGKTTNILNCLDKKTDWFTLAKGDNIFAFTAESGTTNLQFWIENKVIYEGV